MAEIHLSSRLKQLYPNIEITLKQDGKVLTKCSIDCAHCLRDAESEADFSYIPEGENYLITVLFTAYSDCCANCVRNSTKKRPIVYNRNMKDNENLLRIIREQYKYALDYTDFLENTELMRLITAGLFAIILCEGGTHHSRFVAEKLVGKKVPAMYYKFGIRDLEYRANDKPGEYKKILNLMGQLHLIISLLPKKDMEEYHENLTIGALAIPHLTYIDYDYGNNLDHFYTAMIDKYQHS